MTMLPNTAPPEIIAHRRNTLEQLRETPLEYGVEVDIRSQGERLIIHHDPFLDGLGFEKWLADYRHGTLILNVKEEGLEDRLIALMAAAGIERWFFLDQSFPFLIRTARRGERRCAVRISEYESVETALALAGRIDWIWVDLFSDIPPDVVSLRRLLQARFRLCLVSPELQGRPPVAEVARLRDLFALHDIRFDAVCTKEPALWS